MLKLDAAENPFSRRFWTGGIDSRPLALFRVCYGLLLLKDALYHLPLAERLYSDQGILPRYALLSAPYASYRFSLMDSLGPAALVTGFFLAWALVAGCLTLGFRTRLSALLGYVIVLSVQYRNTYVLDGSDAVFRVLGFWSLFLPLGDHYSIDARQRRSREGVAAVIPVRPAPAWALPVRLAQLQIAIIYLATAAFKLRSGTWLSGDALFYTRQLDSLLLPLGRTALAAAPDDWLRFAGVAALAIEGALPFLLLSPIGQPGARLLGLALGAALHIGIAATMSIANFSLLMLSSYWLFVRWEWVEAVARRLGLARAEPGPSPEPPIDQQPARRRPGRTGLAVALVYVMACVGWHNVWTVYYPRVPTIPALQVPLLYVGLWQQWNMFLAGGRRPDGWVQVVATFHDGRVLDVERRAPPSDEMPRRDWGPWLRWKMLERAFDTLPPVHLQAWAESVCVAPSVRALGAPALVELRHRLRPPHAPGAPRSPLQTVVRWRQQCASAAPPGTR